MIWIVEKFVEVSPEKRAEFKAWMVEQDRIALDKQKQYGRHRGDSFVGRMIEQGIPYYGATGGVLTCKITPTSVGTAVVVSHAITNNEFDFTDDISW
jgi:hypothetical protein